MDARHSAQIDFTRPHLGYLSSALTRVHEPDAVREQNRTIRSRLEEAFNVSVYLPQENSDPNRQDSHEAVMSAEEVYLLDRWRVAESDFILLNANHPSFGVGQELEIAGAAGIPVIVYHRSEERVSRMLRGALNIFVPSWQRPPFPSTGPVEYRDDEDLVARLESYLENLLQSRDSVVKVGEISERFSNTLRSARNLKGLDRATLAERSGLTEAFVEFLEEGTSRTRQIAQKRNDPRRPVERLSSVRFINPGLWVVEKLASALDVGLGALLEYDLGGEAQVAVFLDLCDEHAVTYREYMVLSSRFGVDLRPRLLAAKEGPLSNPSVDVRAEFLRELEILRRDG